MLFAPVQYYALVAQLPATAIDWRQRADKRFKAAHRYDIADTRGRLALTVPVEHLSGGLTWGQVAVSAHGQWWHQHRVSLESAYGRTPFFEFYIDRFLPLLADPAGSAFGTVGAMVGEADRLIRQILLLPEAAGVTGPAQPVPLPPGALAAAAFRPYWQVRAASQGFHAGLSILDLIFNLGPEAALYLRQ